MGAEGIGLCRTEHMFFAEDRIAAVREMICARTVEERKTCLLYTSQAGLVAEVRIPVALNMHLAVFVLKPVGRGQLVGCLLYTSRCV